MTEEETAFSASVVLTFFPVPPAATDPHRPERWGTLEDTYGAGQLSSPLYRILREERKLVYGCEVVDFSFPDGGCWGFAAVTRDVNVPHVQHAFWDVLNDPYARSLERNAYVKEVQRCERDMRVLNPRGFTGVAEHRLEDFGMVLSDEERTARLSRFPYDAVLDTLSLLTPERAHTIVFHGKGSEEE